MHLRRAKSVAGFTLIELLLVVAIIALLIGILLPALAEARRAGTLARCLGQIRNLGTATAGYVSENKDRLPSFSWNSSMTTLPTKYSDLQGKPADDLDGAARQAVDIIRRQSGRDDFARQSGWLPHARYTHLVLNDYLGQKLPEKGMACPNDKNLLGWQRDPINWQREAPGPSLARVPYSTSYQLVGAQWIPDRGPRMKVQQTTFNSYSISDRGPDGSTGRRKFTEVAAPSSKVQFYEYYAWHVGRIPLWVGYPDAKAVVLMYDASVRQLESMRANEGWDNMLRRFSYRKQRILFNPSGADGDPPLRNGAYSTMSASAGDLSGGGGGTPPQSFTSTAGYYMWTRGGLDGFDVGGAERDTGSGQYD